MTEISPNESTMVDEATSVAESTMVDEATSVAEYKQYRFLFFLNFAPAIGSLPIGDRKILAEALVQLNPSSELLQFVKRELLYKLTHEAVSGGSEIIQSLLMSMDKMYGGKLSQGVIGYFKANYDTLSPEGKEFFGRIMTMSIIPNHVKAHLTL